MIRLRKTFPARIRSSEVESVEFLGSNGHKIHFRPRSKSTDWEMVVMGYHYRLSASTMHELAQDLQQIDFEGADETSG